MIPSIQAERGDDKYLGMKGEHMLIQLSEQTNKQTNNQVHRNTQIWLLQIHQGKHGGLTESLMLQQ